jgi:4-diphosphocytidyl-2-C-methyl-D-erythritol kinase
MIDTEMCTTPRPAALSARSPAKVNLILDVLGHRADGFHDIHSVVLGVDLADEMRFEDAPAGTLALTCNSSEVPSDEQNLVWKAAHALGQRSSKPCRGAAIELVKHIPVAAGLGGGSSNAATSLLALNALWDLGLDKNELAHIGAELGSDVPLFFDLPSVVVTGRGEVVRPAPISWSGWVLLVFAGVAVSTKDVYTAWSDMGGPRAADADRARFADLARATSADQVATFCSNDLESAVFRVAPEVRSLYEAVCQTGAEHARVSGAGQTIFVLFDERDEAESFRSKLHSSGIGTGAVVVKAPATPLAIC